VVVFIVTNGDSLAPMPLKYLFYGHGAAPPAPDI